MNSKSFSFFVLRYQKMPSHSTEFIFAMSGRVQENTDAEYRGSDSDYNREEKHRGFEIQPC